MDEQEYCEQKKRVLDKTKIILICPDFFGYHKDILNEFKRRGHSVEWLDSRLYKNNFYKIVLRGLPKFVSWCSTEKIVNRFKTKCDGSVERVLIIKGEGISVLAFKSMRKMLPNAKFHFYNWDGVRNSKNSLGIAPLCDSVSTFDPRDAKTFGWSYRPLFSRITKPDLIGAREKAEFDWCFFGTLHSDRLFFLNRIIEKNTWARSYVFGYVQSKVIYYLKFWFSEKVLGRLRFAVSTKPISVEEIKNICNNSYAVLDIEHPDQVGLTMRSIEVLVMEKKLITTNRFIATTDLYDETRVLIIDRYNPVIPKVFLRNKGVIISNEVRERYSISQWVDDVVVYGKSRDDVSLGMQK